MESPTPFGPKLTRFSLCACFVCSQSAAAASSAGGDSAPPAKKPKKVKADGSDANSLRSVDAKFVPAYHSLPLHFESRSATAMDDFLMQVVADLRRLQVFDESSLLSRARELVSQAAVESAYSLFGYRPLPLSGAKGAAAAAAAAASSGSASGDSPAQVESCKLSFVQLKSQKSHEGSVQVYLSDKGKLPLISEAKFRPADGSALGTFLCGRYGKVGDSMRHARHLSSQ